MANEVLKPQTVKVLLEKKKAEVMDRPQKAAIKQVERTAHSVLDRTTPRKDRRLCRTAFDRSATSLRVIAVGVKQIINGRIDIS